MQRTRSRKCSSSSLGMNENDSSPAANSLTSRFASRRSVFTRSPGELGIDPGAITRTSSPRATASRASANPVGPAYRAHRTPEPFQERRHDIDRRTTQPLHRQLTRQRIKDHRDLLP